jgi:hypothetical protein
MEKQRRAFDVGSERLSGGPERRVENLVFIGTFTNRYSTRKRPFSNTSVLPLLFRTCTS